MVTRRTIVAGGLTTLLGFRAEAAPAPPLPDDRISAALERAGKQDKLVFLGFMSASCPHCLSFKRSVLESDAYKEFAAGHLVAVILDNTDHAESPGIEAYTKSLGRYLVEGYPTILVLAPDRRELFRNQGYRGTPAADVVEHLRELYSEWRKDRP